MKTNWNLEIIYKGLDDPKLEEDFGHLKKLLEDFRSLVKDLDREGIIEEILRSLEEITIISNRIGYFLSLSQSTNTEDGKLMAELNRLNKLFSEYKGDITRAEKALGNADIEKETSKNDFLKNYQFILEENKKNLKYMLSEEEEAMAGFLNITGGDAWEQLRNYLSSTVVEDFRGKELNLSELRNLAFDADKDIRKEAYEAEKRAIKKIENSIAFSLNSIKNQVIYLAHKRGYSTPLEQTLRESRMSEETLDAMWEALREALPDLRRYYKKKAELLGYKGGLKWEDMFAPLGSFNKKFTVEESGEYLFNAFDKLSPKVSDMMREAYRDEWIDFFPKKGKVGGAFCAGNKEIKASRILMNFDGSFSSVRTLAHELGHAYHNRQMQDEAPLYQGYPMPIAETASTFNEVHLGKVALKDANHDERVGLLDQNISDFLQITIDIYSRFLFEGAVFKRAENEFLMPDDLNNLMIECQKASYGDGISEETLHPGMWVVKGHYYSSSLSYYNFPYAFGGLYALGLYSIFEEEGEEKFFNKYNEMLRLTPQRTIEEDGLQMGVDVSKKEFWEKGFKAINEMIDEFVSL